MDKSVPSNLFVFSSRRNRLNHILFQILSRILLFAAGVVAISGVIAFDGNANGGANVIILISVLALLVIVISDPDVAVRRSHDIGFTDRISHSHSVFGFYNLGCAHAYTRHAWREHVRTRSSRNS